MERSSARLGNLSVPFRLSPVVGGGSIPERVPIRGGCAESLSGGDFPGGCPSARGPQPGVRTRWS